LVYSSPHVIHRGCTSIHSVRDWEYPANHREISFAHGGGSVTEV